MPVNITVTIANNFDVPVTLTMNLGGNVVGGSKLTPQSPGLQASRTVPVGTPLTRIPSTPGAGAVPVTPVPPTENAA
jgi:hypothetical protein